MLFQTNKKINFIYKQNVSKMLTKTLLQFTEFCSIVTVIDFKQVNVH